MNTIILADRQALQFSAMNFALAWRDRVIGNASLIGRCQNTADNQRITDCMARLKEYTIAVEEARIETKGPFWTACVDIDTLAKELGDDAKAELMRLSKLAGDWQALEEAKANAVNQSRRDDLTLLEKQRQSALAQAQTHEERDQIEERFNATAAALPKAEVPKAAGQTKRHDWEIEVFDKLALANAHPGCVEITPRLREIKGALDAGAQLAGVRARKVPKIGVKTKREAARDEEGRRLIDV